ncbi:hypothetical protein [Roseococcus suduntuyensis]|uniref:Uncharacterized protein n=1 Tax=Roseococcus suduntuyensis TaxID=455361 RepID=A0A840AIQ5_9PROT|nr:hypothetical protein [Roseococcus suduntuyensis]MBB3900436.1 hypothetical protein [Roseococcus suduntuyensis]
MTDEEIAALVKAAGLEDAAARYPADVRAALAQLARQRGQLPRSGDPALEPTPAFVAPRA